jgi:hypothetical protein
MNQSIVATVLDANTCLRWLGCAHLICKKRNAAASRVVKDAIRAMEIIKRVRLFQEDRCATRAVKYRDRSKDDRAPVQWSSLALHLVQTELALDFPNEGSRELQQVLINSWSMALKR